MLAAVMPMPGSTVDQMETSITTSGKCEYRGGGE